jgi:acyl-CoA hydrolase
MNFDNYKVIKPGDLNHHGNLFGGTLLQWVDEFSWIAASLEFPDYSFVTRSMDKVMFKKSVRQGAILNFNITKCEQGRAYVNYKVIVIVKNQPKTNIIFETVVTFVSVDDNGKIKPFNEAK